MIEVKDLSHRVGTRDILKQINLTIRHGELLAVLGPNGAGKSTLLKAVTGTVDTISGSIYLEGKKLTSYSIRELSRKRAVLSQSSSISFPFTAREIVMMGLSPHAFDRVPAWKKSQIVDEVARRLEAEHLLERLFVTLSGGEQQRIQFARALVQIWEQDKAYLFLDEPTSALDLKQQLKIVDLAKELSNERNFAVFMIVHDLNLARHYADRVLLLKQGEVAFSGTPDEILQASTIAETFDIPLSYAAKFSHI